MQPFAIRPSPFTFMQRHNFPPSVFYLHLSQTCHRQYVYRHRTAPRFSCSSKMSPRDLRTMSGATTGGGGGGGDGGGRSRAALHAGPPPAAVAFEVGPRDLLDDDFADRPAPSAAPRRRRSNNGGTGDAGGGGRASLARSVGRFRSSVAGAMEELTVARGYSRERAKAVLLGALGGIAGGRCGSIGGVGLLLPGPRGGGLWGHEAPRPGPGGRPGLTGRGGGPPSGPAGRRPRPGPAASRRRLRRSTSSPPGSAWRGCARPRRLWAWGARSEPGRRSRR